jgi:hypothetical protein
MANSFAQLIWSEKHHPASVASVDEVDEWLDRISATCKPELPTIVTIEALNHEILIGLGLPQSVVQIMSISGDPPYLVTLGNPNAAHSVDFYLHRYHPTEIRGRNLIPTPLARKVVRHFLETGRRSSDVEWEEV